MWCRAVVVVLMCVFGLPGPLGAQEWARKMFQTTSHDFGTVARGAKAEFRFALSNIYLEDVNIASVRSSCGCTTPQIENGFLKTYEKGAIVATFNTPKFLGSKGATLTVTFDKPFYAEVQLQVRGYIRSDVVFNPGSVEFGTVPQGVPAERRVAVNYAGRNDWQILAVQSSNPHVSTQVIETARGNGLVSYELAVRLDPNSPPGYLNDHLVLQTNDRRSTQVPLAVEGRVQSAITVSPASLFMGVIQAGQKVTKQLVVKGSKPFRILSITCDDKAFEFDTSGETAPKPVHLIPVTFAAGHDSGKVTKTIRIETDLGDSKPELSAYAVITKP